MTVNLTVLSAGERTNIIPDRATANLNVRVREQRQLDDLLAGLRERAARPAVPDAKVEIAYDVSFPPQPEVARNAAQIDRARKIYAGIGRTLATAGSGGGSESALAQLAGIPVLDGLGPVGAGFHSRDERLDLTTLAPRLYLLAKLLMNK